jgi:hypothetical protein
MASCGAAIVSGGAGVVSGAGFTVLLFGVLAAAVLAAALIVVVVLRARGFLAAPSEVSFMSILKKIL